MFAYDWWAAGGNVRLALDILCHAAGGRSHFIARLLLAERRVDDNGVSKIAPSAVVDGQAAAFCHDRLSVRTGMFIGISVVGMFYLQNVAQLSPAAAGALMLPGRSLHLSPLCLPDVTSIGLGRVR